MDVGPTRDTPSGKRLAVLSVAVLGVVYGDLGTSPLYAVRETFHVEHGLAVNAGNVLGVLSLIFWSLVLVVSVKYVAFVLRADSRGEGGILTLTSLVTPMAQKRGGRQALILLGLFGAALLYGDGMITPAISVLSAVEGLSVATPVFNRFVIPITVVVLVALFAIQHRGTAGVGKLFGPVTFVWFVVLAVLGVYQIVQEPGVLVALSPVHAVRFFLENGLRGFLALGSIFLVLTGAEALYADMGHFGTRPIRLMWFALVLPALVLNYLGQGAILLRDPTAVESPFFRMAPEWAVFPLVGLATAAAVIASQAVISGSFSLAMQSVQLGYSPRLGIEHTSETEKGQIYIPEVSWALMIACIGLVIGFGSSTALAGAYGVAVTTTMVVTTVLFYFLAHERWGWPRPLALAVTGVFLVVDLAFWVTNMMKIPDGGWFPLAVAALVFLLMTTWKSGRRRLGERMKARELPLTEFLASISAHPPTRVEGTAVFMFGDPDGTPRALLHNLKHNRVLHKQVVFLAVRTEDVPHVAASERVTFNPREGGFYSVILRYGFMDEVDLMKVLGELNGREGLRLHPLATTFFLGREWLVPSAEGSGMSRWRERLFAFMSHNARSPTAFYRLPPNQVVELGARIEL
ncbi:MAG: potassium transporter Kup [Longimicrobiales bacterium]|nr:potassium transporter Kup [Longimicrobiales bacterium]